MLLPIHMVLKLLSREMLEHMEKIIEVACNATIAKPELLTKWYA